MNSPKQTSDTEKLREQCDVQEKSKQPLVRVNRLAYLRFPRKDLEKAIAFFLDFGLILGEKSLDEKNEGLAYFRGIDRRNYAIILDSQEGAKAAIGLEVDNLKDLEKLSKQSGNPIQTRHCPLGGRYVALQDPENNRVEVNFGLQTLTEISAIKGTLSNTPTKHPRLNSVVRPALSPSPISRLGHTVFGVANIKKTVEWYQNTLGFIASDFQMLGDDPIPSVAFLRCDTGSTPADHHTIAIGSAIDIGHLHTAFEVNDIDTIAMGGKWLKQKGYKHSWGIGRHILGSQIFDYWRDPWGFQFEHYSDGDLFDSTISTGYELFHGDSMHQWGPDVTKDMLGNKISFTLLKTVLRRLFTKGDLNAKRLKAMIKATS